MSRPENKTIKLPESGKEVTIKQYVSAGFYMDIAETPINRRTKPSIEALVVSFDGTPENVYTRIRDELEAKDYMLIEAEILRVITEATGEDKKKSDSEVPANDAGKDNADGGDAPSGGTS